MKSKSSKASKQKEAEPAPVSDPLSGAAGIDDPLSSFSPANDPLSAALLDPLSQAVSETFGTVEKKKVPFLLVIMCISPDIDRKILPTSVFGDV